VLAKDKGASLSTIGEEHSAIAFATTQWSVVLTAQGESPEAQKALERLCRTYWWPLYSFVRRQGYTPEEAQDLTQSFFVLFLERRDFDAVRRERGVCVPIFSRRSRISSVTRAVAPLESSVVKASRLCH
jgi:hypothetical protein